MYSINQRVVITLKCPYSRLWELLGTITEVSYPTDRDETLESLERLTTYTIKMDTGERLSGVFCDYISPVGDRGEWRIIKEFCGWEPV